MELSCLAENKDENKIGTLHYSIFKLVLDFETNAINNQLTIPTAFLSQYLSIKAPR